MIRFLDTPRAFKCFYCICLLFFIIKENISKCIYHQKTCCSYPLVIFISISVRNRLKNYNNIDVYFIASIYHKSTLCISYLKVVILLQDSLKIKLQLYPIYSLQLQFLFISYTHKVCTLMLPIFMIKHFPFLFPN